MVIYRTAPSTGHDVNASTQGTDLVEAAFLAAPAAPATTTTTTAPPATTTTGLLP